MDTLVFGLSVGAVGMLVVFAGLALLIFCIKGMELAFRERSRKNSPTLADATAPALPAQPAIEAGISPEVIAAITAAISAVWQEDVGFVVRRVRRIHNAPAWNRAGRDDQIYSRL
jgi:sodium pump decarboxylase gamma subunit